MVLDRSLRAHIGLRTVAAALIAVLAPSSAERAPGQEPAAEGWSIERMDREVEVDEQGALTIENLYGDLRVRVGAPGRMEAHAVVQRNAEDPRRAKLELGVPDAPGLRVSFSGGIDRAEPPTWSRRRVDLVVAVPPQTALRLRTDSGSIEVKGAVGTLEAESVGGEVRIWVPSECRIRTREGAVTAHLLGDSWSRSARFETVNGPIEIELPASADVLLEAETAGRLTTDFSVEISWPGRRRKRAVSRLGDGSAKVLARSENGSIALLRRMPGPTPSAPLGRPAPLR